LHTGQATPALAQRERNLEDLDSVPDWLIFIARL
jgi:hypothetical protein